MTLSTLLIIILILILIGVVPTWGHSRGWGYGPSGIVGLILVVIIVLSSNGQALTGLVFSALCAAAAERSNVHGTFAFQFPACSLRQRAGLVRRSIAEIENPVAGGANQVSIRAVRWGANNFNPHSCKCSVDGRPADTLRPRRT